jgi:hypothetical protein
MSPAQAPRREDTVAYPALLLPSLLLQQLQQQPEFHPLLLRCQWCGLLLLSWLLLLPLLLPALMSSVAWAAGRLVLLAVEGRGSCCCCRCGRNAVQYHRAACCRADSSTDSSSQCCQQGNRTAQTAQQLTGSRQQVAGSHQLTVVQRLDIRAMPDKQWM